MATSFNPAAFNSELGNYYREMWPTLHAELELGFLDAEGPLNLGNRFNIISPPEDQLGIGSADVVPFVRQFNPADAATFIPTVNAVVENARILQMRLFKGDLLFVDDQMYNTWNMYIGRSKEIADLPQDEQMIGFIEYLFMNKIIKKMNADLRQAVIQGVYNATASYGLINILDGLEQILSTAVTATQITVNTLPTLTAQNVRQAVWTVFDTLSPQIKNADDLVVILNQSMFDLWVRADVRDLGLQWNYDSSDLHVEGYKNARIVCEPLLATYKIIIHRQENCMLGVKSQEMWEVQRVDRTSKMMINGKAGLQYQEINPGTTINMAIGA
jgi:hypothetical protein